MQACITIFWDLIRMHKGMPECVCEPKRETHQQRWFDYCQGGDAAAFTRLRVSSLRGRYTIYIHPESDTNIIWKRESCIEQRWNERWSRTQINPLPALAPAHRTRNFTPFFLMNLSSVRLLFWKLTLIGSMGTPLVPQVLKLIAKRKKS